MPIGCCEARTRARACTKTQTWPTHNHAETNVLRHVRSISAALFYYTYPPAHPCSRERKRAHVRALAAFGEPSRSPLPSSPRHLSSLLFAIIFFSTITIVAVDLNVTKRTRSRARLLRWHCQISEAPNPEHVLKWTVWIFICSLTCTYLCTNPFSSVSWYRHQIRPPWTSSREFCASEDTGQ